MSNESAAQVAPFTSDAANRILLAVQVSTVDWKGRTRLLEADLWQLLEDFARLEDREDRRRKRRRA